MKGQEGERNARTMPSSRNPGVLSRFKNKFRSRSSSSSRDDQTHPSATQSPVEPPNAAKKDRKEVVARDQPDEPALPQSTTAVTDTSQHLPGNTSQDVDLANVPGSTLPVASHVAPSKTSLGNTVIIDGHVPETSSPIRELWDQAYEDLRAKEGTLVRDYEATLCGSLSTMIGSTVVLSGSKISRRDQMRTVLQEKMEEVDRNTWKSKFHGSEIPVRDLVGPVVGVIDWANQYISDAVSANPYASIAWAGVGLLLPLFLNPSKQAASLATGLEYISGLIVQSSMRESLYSRRYELNSGEVGYDDLLNSHIAFRDTLKELYIRILTFQAKSVYYYSKISALRAGSDMVAYDDWGSLLDRIKSQEEKFCKVNELWKDTRYEEDRTAMYKRHQDCIKSLNSIGGDVSGLRRAIEDAQHDNQRKELLGWLSSIDPSENYNSARDKHEGETSNWLVAGNDDFKSWKRAANSLLWLHGKAGSGKSILSSSVIKHLITSHDSDPRSALGYFYFSFSDSEKQTTIGMLGSLIKQLCCRRPDALQFVKSLGQYKEKGQRPDTKTLEATLLATFHGFSRVYLVIDALDECPSKSGERKRLLDCLYRIHIAKSENLHLLCTSRRELDIEAALNPLLSLPSNTALDLSAYKDAVDHDIGIYIDDTLASSDYESWPERIKEEARATLIENADGMFQYISCQFEILRGLASLDLVRKALKDLPSGLDATYDRMLHNIHTDHQKQVRSLLNWLAFSFRPLIVEEVAEAFILDHEEPIPFDENRRLFKPEVVLKYLPGLVTSVPIIIDRHLSPWDKNMSEEVKLAHFSVKEYLISSRIPNSPAAKFSITETNAHLHIAESCLAYHLHISKRELATQESLKRFALWEYASRYWTSHLEEVAREFWTDSVIMRARLHFTPHARSLLNIARIRRFKYEDDSLEADELASPLLYAAITGALHLATLLITDGADVNERPLPAPWGDALQGAASYGKENVVQLLLDNSANVNAQGGQYGNALQAAAWDGNESIVQILLDKGADVNAEGGEYGNALHAAVQGRSERMVQLLLDKGADVNAQGGYYKNALQAAAYNGNKSIVQPLLDKGADVNAQGGQYGNALQAAAYNGNDSIVQLLLDKGADVNAQGGEYGNALRAAAWRGSKSIVQLLLDKGANVNAQGGEYGNALHAALWSGDKRMVQLLLDKGADVNAQGGEYGNALQAAAYDGNKSIVQLLLDKGADVNAQGGGYGNALLAALWSGDKRIVQLLLEKGADFNAQGGKYGNALQTAVQLRNERLVQLLLEKGADFNAQGGAFGNELQAAAYDGNKSIVQLLLDKGADVNAQGGKYGNALQAAARGGNESIVQLLLDKGADVNAQGGHYGDALQAAAYDGNKSIVQLLLDKGADVNTQGGEYGNALKAAIDGKNHKVIELLLSWGAEADSP